MLSGFKKQLAVAEADRRRRRRETFTTPVRVNGEEAVAEFKKFLLDFYRNIYHRRAEIKQLLEDHSGTLGKHFAELVPRRISYEDFWQRYYWRCDPDWIVREWEERDRQAREARAEYLAGGLARVQNYVDQVTKNVQAARSGTGEEVEEANTQDVKRAPAEHVVLEEEAVSFEGTTEEQHVVPFDEPSETKRTSVDPPSIQTERDQPEAFLDQKRSETLQKLPPMRTTQLAGEPTHPHEDIDQLVTQSVSAQPSPVQTDNKEETTEETTPIPFVRESTTESTLGNVSRLTNEVLDEPKELEKDHPNGKGKEELYQGEEPATTTTTLDEAAMLPSNEDISKNVFNVETDEDRPGNDSHPRHDEALYQAETNKKDDRAGTTANIKTDAGMSEHLAVQDGQPEAQKAPSTHSKRHVIAAITMAVLALCVPFLVRLSLPLMDALCSPAMVNTILTAEQDHITLEAPWWAPNTLKTTCFVMCASRPRIQIKWESVKKGRHLLSLVSLGKGGEEVVCSRKVSCRHFCYHLHHSHYLVEEWRPIS